MNLSTLSTTIANEACTLLTHVPLFRLWLGNGIGGAILMGIGIFLPATIIPILGHDLLQWAVDNRVVQPFLDGIATAVLGLLLQTAFVVRITLCIVRFEI